MVARLLGKIGVIGAFMLFILALAGMFWTLRGTWQEHEQHLAQQRELERQVAEARTYRESHENYLRRALSGDRVFFERIVRQQLGYVKPGETVYRFDTSEETNAQ